MPHQNVRRARGFTLIEIMIVVAILGILATLAIPSYQDSVRKSRRAEARALLAKGAQTMELKFTQSPGTGYSWTASDIWLSSELNNQFYTLAVATGTASAFSLTATPVAGSDQANDKCGTFAIDQQNNKSVSGGTLTAPDCWPS